MIKILRTLLSLWIVVLVVQFYSLPSPFPEPAAVGTLHHDPIIPFTSQVARSTATVSGKNKFLQMLQLQKTKQRSYPNHPIHYKPFWLVVSKKRNVAVTIIPKVMCSSIKTAMNEIECDGPSATTTGVTNDTTSRFLTECAEVRHNPLLREEVFPIDTGILHNMTRVLFVRDPFERAYSAWQNSVVTENIRTRECASSAECSFGYWIRSILKDGNQGETTNEHFRTQKSIAQLNRIQYHYILRLSSPTDQQFFWNTLLNRTNPLMVNRSRRRGSDTATAATSSAAQQIYQSMTWSDLDIMETLYFEDFVLWEAALRHGSPRADGEITVYDLYKADRRRNQTKFQNAFWEW